MTPEPTEWTADSLTIIWPNPSIRIPNIPSFLPRWSPIDGCGRPPQGRGDISWFYSLWLAGTVFISRHPFVCLWAFRERWLIQSNSEWIVTRNPNKGYLRCGPHWPSLNWTQQEVIREFFCFFYIFGCNISGFGPYHWNIWFIYKTSWS